MDSFGWIADQLFMAMFGFPPTTPPEHITHSTSPVPTSITAREGDRDA
jgi:hypothetical protein